MFGRELFAFAQHAWSSNIVLTNYEYVHAVYYYLIRFFLANILVKVKLRDYNINKNHVCVYVSFDLIA